MHRKKTRSGNKEEYHYFVAHEFSAQEKDDLRESIEEAFRGTGLKAYYADMEVKQEHILRRIEKRIFTTQFGIYDVTTNNPNVYLELGIAIGAKKPYYIILKKGTKCLADLQGLDRIEYESYKHLTKEIKSKIVKVEVERFKEIKEGQKIIQKYEKLPEDKVRKRCVKLYKAEELLHRFGYEVEDKSASNNKAWFADLSEQSHHVIYGPYEALEEEGDYIALFRIKINDNSLKDPLLLLDVVGATYKVKRIVRGIDFNQPHLYQLFGLKFKVEQPLPIMEYRIFNIRKWGKIWVDYIAIVKAEAFTK